MIERIRAGGVENWSRDFERAPKADHSSAANCGTPIARTRHEGHRLGRRCTRKRSVHSTLLSRLRMATILVVTVPNKVEARVILTAT